MNSNARARRSGLVLAACLFASSTLGQNLSVHWVSPPQAPQSATVEVKGLSRAQLAALRRSQRTLAQWQKLLAVHAEASDSTLAIGVPAMVGEYQVADRKLRFTPGFPLVPGVRYRAAFYPEQLPAAEKGSVGPLLASWQMPARRTNSTTVVTQIYPSTDLVPENLLKFYLHFSGPMSRGHIYDHIHLRNESGLAVELPFLEIDEELWDPDMKRLTLFIDPGRIKRGVQPLEEIGPALENGRRYTLTVDRNWRDASGNPLQSAFAKQFVVGPADRTPPDPKLWKIDAPRAGTREPLRVSFTDPMDHALAQRVIHVARRGSSAGEQISGQVTLSDQEKRWVFTPAAPWRGGVHELLTLSTIEDLAGNNVGKPFEVDVFDGVQRRFTNSTIGIRFDVR